MFELNHDALLGHDRNYKHHASLTSKHMRYQNGHNRNHGMRLMSVRKTDSRPLSIMPKTAINFYNLRKGLYLKNGAASTAVKLKPKSSSLLNGFTDYANNDNLEVGAVTVSPQVKKKLMVNSAQNFTSEEN